MLEPIQEARQVLEEAEESLRELIQRCVDQKRYSEIAQIAELTQHLAALRLPRSHARPAALESPAGPARGSEDKPATRTQSKNSRKVRASKKRLGDYPLFKKDGGRLVKVGWSKKNRREYEHRAERAVVMAIVDALRSLAGSDGLATGEQIVAAAPSDVPDYQVYLVLAWLRETGLVSKSGRDGYQLNEEKLTADVIDTAWKRI